VFFACIQFYSAVAFYRGDRSKKKDFKERNGCGGLLAIKRLAVQALKKFPGGWC
jgi:hypothetical protein